MINPQYRIWLKEKLEKNANIPIGDKKELRTSRLGAMIGAGMVGPAFGQKLWQQYGSEISNPVRSAAKAFKSLPSEQRKTVFKNLNLKRMGRVGGVIAGTTMAATGIGALVGSKLGKNMEKILIVNKKK